MNWSWNHKAILTSIWSLCQPSYNLWTLCKSQESISLTQVFVLALPKYEKSYNILVITINTNPIVVPYQDLEGFLHSQLLQMNVYSITWCRVKKIPIKYHPMNSKSRTRRSRVCRSPSIFTWGIKWKGSMGFEVPGNKYNDLHRSCSSWSLEKNLKIMKGIFSVLHFFWIRSFACLRRGRRWIHF